MSTKDEDILVSLSHTIYQDNLKLQTSRCTHPQIRILEVGTVVFDNMMGVTLLHDGDLLDDLLQVRVDGYLFDGQHLPRLLV